MTPSALPEPIHFASLGFGVGLRAPHYRDFLRQRPRVDWLEVHTENYFEAGGWDVHVLDQLCQHYPISLHGVGLGIGSAVGFSEQHLRQVADTVRRVEPVLVSEHLSWGTVHGRHLNDLLPMPLTREALQLVVDRVDRIQEVLGRRLLLENVSTYLRFCDDAMSEAEFLSALVRRTGCGILLDINNLYVNQQNHGEDPLAAFDAIPLESIGEFHLAGHLVTADALIDNHGAPVAAPVWALYETALRRFGMVSTLIEWDTEIPDLAVLLNEAEQARAIAERVQRSVVTPALAEQQRRIASALFDVAVEATVLPLFKGDTWLTQQRLALYRGNLSATWSKALASAYPVMRELVGEEFFDALARAYGHSYPSTSGDLNRYGDEFPCFLRDFAHVAAYPYFADVARCEWAVHRAHFAAIATPLAPIFLATLSAEQFDSMQVDLHPACTLVASPWAVVDIWLAHQPDANVGLPSALATASFGVSVRPQWRAQLLSLPHAGYAALQSLQRGDSLGSALDAALEIDPEFDLAIHLQTWLVNAVLIARTP